MLEHFEEETGVDPQYRMCGYLFVLTTPEDVEAFRKNVAMQRSLGVPTEWLDGDQIRERLPYMHFPDALGGTIHARDGLADPNSVLMGYINRARDLGVGIHTEVEATGIEVHGGRVRGVVTDHGRIECDQIVNATGPWLAEIGRMVGLQIPVQPVRRQMITTTPLPDLPEDFPFVIDFASSLYFHREGEGLLTGMSDPGQKPGFDQQVNDQWELIAMEAAVERMPMLSDAGRLAGWAGLYEVTPDAHPIFGGTPVDGFWVVGGFSGHGFMHGPIAGVLMSEFILDGSARSVDVSMLDLARFEEQRLIQEYNVI